MFMAGVTFAFPLTIEHKYGTTVIEKKPERVATVDYNGVDNLLALGIQPVAIRYWYGEDELGVWSWAKPKLMSTPALLKGDLNYEQIAATHPDVIIAIWSGITKDDYDKLSKIAPVVAVPEGTGDYSMPWDEQALTVGKVVGKEHEAQNLIDGIRQKLSDIAAAHPQWANKTVAIANRWQDSVGAYTSFDIRPLLMAELGFRTPKAIDAAIDANEFWVTFSMEDLSPIDADILMWVTSTDDFTTILEIPARPFLTVVKQEREIFLGAEVTGAFSFASLLSLDYAFEKMIPMIESALGESSGTVENKE
jgi:iron complex transport system substrate-binding protein